MSKGHPHLPHPPHPAFTTPGPQGCSPSGPFPLLTFGLRVREGLYMKGRARGKWLVPPGVHCLSLGASCTSQAPLEEAGRGC